MVHGVFVTGGTGYMGSRLIPELAARGHSVLALVRPQSRHKLPPKCEAVIGEALDKGTFINEAKRADTFVQLIGVPHPSPAKGEQFRSIDLVAARAGIAAAEGAGISHFIYVSVARPAPVMKEYQAVRAEAEALLRDSRMNATVLQPWYVLGPGHWWPLLLLPGYWICNYCRQRAQEPDDLDWSPSGK